MSRPSDVVCFSMRTPPASSIASNATCGSDWKRRHWRSSSCGSVHSHESVLTVVPRGIEDRDVDVHERELGDRGDAAGTTGLGVRDAAGGEECG